MYVCNASLSIHTHNGIVPTKRLCIHGTLNMMHGGELINWHVIQFYNETYFKAIKKSNPLLKRTF